MKMREGLSKKWDITLFFGVLLSLNAWAEPKVVGHLIEAEGQVKLNGKPADLGARLRLGMRVVTGASSRAVLEFNDKQLVSLKPGSVFWIKDYHYIKDNRYTKSDAKANRSSVELFRGGMRFISGLISRETPEAVKIGTPVATIGIRGTEFTVIAGGSCLLVHEGKVAITSADKTLVASPGKIVFVRNKGSPLQYVPLSRLRSCDASHDTAGSSSSAGSFCVCRALVAALAVGATASSLPKASNATGASAAVSISGMTAAGMSAVVAAGAALVDKISEDDDPDASLASP